MDYLVKFARYKDGETRVSGAVFIRADGFASAYASINERLTGMEAADPDAMFHIERIEARGFQRVIDCEGGGRLFETTDEFSERVAQEKST